MENANGRDVTLPSGAILYVSPGAWEDVSDLKDEFARGPQAEVQG